MGCVYMTGGWTGGALAGAAVPLPGRPSIALGFRVEERTAATLGAGVIAGPVSGAASEAAVTPRKWWHRGLSRVRRKLGTGGVVRQIRRHRCVTEAAGGAFSIQAFGPS